MARADIVGTQRKYVLLIGSVSTFCHLSHYCFLIMLIENVMQAVANGIPRR